MPRRSVTPTESAEATTLETAPVRRRRVSRKTAATPVDTAVRSEERVSEPKETPVVAASSRPVRRKAPPRSATVATATEPVVAERVAAVPVRSLSSRRYPWIIVSGVIIIGIAGSAALGLSDTGTIDVGAKLQQHAASGSVTTDSSGNETTVAGQYVPVQNTPSDVPNGGLRGRGVDSAATPIALPDSGTVEATATASSSPEINEGATSTESTSADTASTTTSQNVSGDGAVSQ